MSNATSQDVSNASFYNVRASANAANERIQHVRLDIGTGTTESLVSVTSPIPIADVDYTTRVDDVDDNTSYYGFALPGSLDSEAKWKILKKTTSGTVKSYKWANGAATFISIWNNRASLTYV